MILAAFAVGLVIGAIVGAAAVIYREASVEWYLTAA